MLIKMQKNQNPNIRCGIDGYIVDIELKEGLRTYVTNVANTNSVITPYIYNTNDTGDFVNIEILSVVQGDVKDLNYFEGMKSVAFDKGLYIESIKTDENIFNGYLKLGGLNYLTGDEYNASDKVITPFIFVKEGVKYSWDLEPEYRGTIYVYDDRKNFTHKTHSLTENTSAIFSGKFIRIQFNTPNTKILFMLNEGERKPYSVPVFNRSRVLYKDNGKWNPVKHYTV